MVLLGLIRLFLRSTLWVTSRQLRLTPNLLSTNTLQARIQKEKTTREPYSLPFARQTEAGLSWQGVLVTPRRQSCPMMFVTERA